MYTLTTNEPGIQLWCEDSEKSVKRYFVERL